MSMWRCRGGALWLSLALAAMLLVSAQAQLTFSSGWKRSGAAAGGGRGGPGGGGIEVSMSADDCRPDRAVLNIYDLIKNEAVRLLACQQK